MEHSFSGTIWLLRGWLISLILSVLMTLTGCKSEDPNPQLSDFIFKTLEGDLKAAQALEASTVKQVEEIEQRLAKAGTRTKDRKIALMDLEKARRLLKLTTQKVKYLEIRLERRQAEVKVNYRNAFREGKPWPNPREKDFFLVHRRLRSPSVTAQLKAPPKNAKRQE